MNRGLKQFIKNKNRQKNKNRIKQFRSIIALEIMNVLENNYIGQSVGSFYNQLPIVTKLIIDVLE